MHPVAFNDLVLKAFAQRTVRPLIKFGQPIEAPDEITIGEPEEITPPPRQGPPRRPTPPQQGRRAPSVRGPRNRSIVPPRGGHYSQRGWDWLFRDPRYAGRGSWGVPPRTVFGTPAFGGDEEEELDPRQPSPKNPDDEPGIEYPPYIPRRPEEDKGEPSRPGYYPPGRDGRARPGGRAGGHPLYRPVYRISAQDLQSVMAVQMIKPFLQWLQRIADMFLSPQNQQGQQGQQQQQQVGKIFERKPQTPQQIESGAAPPPQQPPAQTGTEQTPPNASDQTLIKEEALPQGNVHSGSFLRHANRYASSGQLKKANILFDFARTLTAVPGVVGFSMGATLGPAIYYIYPKATGKKSTIRLHDLAYGALMGGLSGASLDIATRLLIHALFK